MSLILIATLLSLHHSFFPFLSHIIYPNPLPSFFLVCEVMCVTSALCILPLYGLKLFIRLGFFPFTLGFCETRRAAERDFIIIIIADFSLFIFSLLCPSRLMDREGGSNGGSCYYAVLGIRKDASFSDVRTAYRKLALVNFPPNRRRFLCLFSSDSFDF